ncbi:tRNA (N6-threonylcarbamoyladenosine(37)-N6)-methyltransferase TrmO [Candidatus Geothermarchaeota archaeon]|nr:MAG: tRNA (N6-threonylcarbamoyladenosine(37)-N6)-methyltransferase TrmO [Candidatus Geothermarchaeota archaeon]HEW93228.1 tRNA (N6-threonylcarbamoyladenosine(37)-N6)-methyltransferase TrmO [Thermoprotei archaeon]
MSGVYEIRIKPIGVVRRKEVATYSLDILRMKEAYIEIFKDYRDAMYRIEDNKLLWILWYSHLAEHPKNFIIYPRGDKRRGKKGIFSTRSPSRPNNIMLSLVKLIKRIDNILIVKGIDAYDGSPVIDIKPYSNDLDNPEKVMNL